MRANIPLMNDSVITHHVIVISDWSAGYAAARAVRDAGADATPGFVRLLSASQTGEQLRLKIVGLQAGELIRGFVAVMLDQSTVRDLLRRPRHHLTLAELPTYAPEAIVGELVSA